MPMVPHRYDNPAAVHATTRARAGDSRGTAATPPVRPAGERTGRAPAPPTPVSETAVSQADGEA